MKSEFRTSKFDMATCHIGQSCFTYSISLDRLDGQIRQWTYHRMITQISCNTYVSETHVMATRFIRNWTRKEWHRLQESRRLELTIVTRIFKALHDLKAVMTALAVSPHKVLFLRQNK